jgi:AraC-like DNA-binding protein
LLKHDQPFTYSGRLITRWAGVTVPIDHFEDMEIDSAAAVTATPGETRTRTEGWMLDTHAASRRLASARGEDTIVFVDPAASAAAEEEVLSSAALVLQSSTAAVDKHVGRPQVSRSRIIARCLELMDASAGQPMLIGDLCRASQVSERTLRNVFQEYFGVGPMRLLKVRQLREIRAALAAADGGEQTVAKIAARFGVWDFSLFARNYRALYGETPSTTLRSAPQRHTRSHTMPKTWIRYAAQRFRDSDEMARIRTNS